MGFPYTTMGVGTLSHYPCGPLAGSLIDTVNAQSLVEQNSVGVKSGAGDSSPSGNGSSRGGISRDGSPGGFFTRNIDHTNSTFDVRGLTSHAMVMWVRLNTGLAQPFAWSHWNFVAANQQAWVLWARLGVGGSPRFSMYDGLTLNMNLSVFAFDSGSIDNNSWHMIGGGFNASTNIINCFWGDGSDATGNTFHYQETAGFAAGYAATLIDCQCNNVGKFSSTGDTPDFDIDHATHWKGRAFDEDDYLNHWQAGTGLTFAEFAADPGRGFNGADTGADYNYYYRSRAN